jgi:hypothetical protein
MEECISCRKSKVFSQCQLCEGSLCKACVQTLSSDAFQFLEVIPTELSHSIYCGSCFDENVAAQLQDYQETLELAKQAFVFFKTQRKEIPLIKRSREIVRVVSSADRDQTILQLGFLAAKMGYNAVIEVDVKAEKLRNGAYQTSRWSGTGVPAQVDAEKIAAQDLQNQIYR